MIVSERDFALELSDDWRRGSRDGGHEWLRGDDTQLIITTYQLDGDAPAGPVLDRMVELRREAIRKLDPGATLGAVARREHPDRIVATFECTASDPAIVQFTGVVVTMQPVAGNHALLSFAYTCSPAHRSEGRALLDTMRFQPHSAALRRAEARAGDTDLTRLYPYIAPATYLEQPAGAKAAVRAIGHGLVQLFAEDCDGVCRVLSYDDVGVPDLTLDAALAHARTNLEGKLRAGEIRIAQHEVEGVPLVRFGDHWLAAACTVVPGVCELVRSTLGTPDLYAMIPHRDVLLCFAAATPAAVERVAAVIRENEREGRKPLTAELFRLEPGGPRPI